ncbi:hypothetical protein DENSPDRAFT_846082 [Dentipellis sp. KUC8613]|nr:hypothetical protein DENSPDRAFT_846082 [Dentipellis sp. KUC8613]
MELFMPLLRRAQMVPEALSNERSKGIKCEKILLLGHLFSSFFYIERNSFSSMAIRVASIYVVFWMEPLASMVVVSSDYTCMLE